MYCVPTEAAVNGVWPSAVTVTVSPAFQAAPLSVRVRVASVFQPL